MEQLPTAGIQWAQLAQAAEAISTTIESVSTFSLKRTQNPESARDLLISQASKQYDQLLNAFLPYIPYLTLRGAQVFEVVKQSQTLLVDTRNTCDQAVAHMAEQKTAVDGIIQAARDAAAKIGVAKFATKFEDTAKEHEEFSTKWLITAAFSGLVTLVTTAWLVYLGPIWPLDKLPADTSVLPYVVTTLAFVSVLSLATLWSWRNYKSHRHLGIVNRHRQDALSTFETFVEASADDATKDAVLLEETKCIFTPGVSGYLFKEPVPPAARMIEVVNSIAGSGS